VDVQRQVSPEMLATLMATCQETPTYLDKFYALQPGRPNGAKRLIVLLPLDCRPQVSEEWLATIGELATLVWRAEPAAVAAEEEMDEHEFTFVGEA